MLLKNRLNNDITTSESNQVDSSANSYGPGQIIFDPKQILLNSSSFIDLIYANQIIMEKELRTSLKPNCHHPT